MHFHQWLDSVRLRLQGKSSSVRGKNVRRRAVRPTQIPTETLEQRALLSVSSLLVAGELSIFIDGADSVTVRPDPSDMDLTNGAPLQVLENGVAATTVGGANINQVRSIRIRGGGGANAIDLSAVSAASFTALVNGIRVDGGDGADTITGSADFNDTLIGSDGDDSILGGAGNNTIDSGDGHDSVSGGAGADTIDSGDGHDLVMSGAGNDSVRGGDGDDTLSGEAGDDVINAGHGEDLVNGNDGADSLQGDLGADTVNGDTGNDFLNGGGGADSMSGGDDNDTLFGVGLSDTLFGDAGDDSLDGGGSNDLIDGGDGNDTIDAGATNDTVTGGLGDDLIYGGAGEDSLSGGEGTDSIFGNGGNDSIYGNNGQDVLQGGSGNDLIDATDDVNVPVAPTPTARLFATALDGSNSIVELDPADGKEIKRFAAPEPFGTGGDGMAFDGLHLYYMNGFGNDILYEIDPDTGTVIDADPLSIGSRNYEGIAVLGGLVYILDYTVGDIAVFDPATDTILRTIDVNGLNPTVSLLIGGMAGIANPDRIVIVEAGGNRVHLLDPNTGLVTSSFSPTGTSAGSYYGAGVLGGEIYLASGTTSAVDVYSRTGALQRSFTPAYAISALGADDIGTNPVPPGGGSTSVFDINLTFDASITASQQAIFRAAADRWESIIVGDVPDVIVPGFGMVDDITIDISTTAIDLVGNVLAETQLIAARVSSFLPSAADIRFDSADLNSLESGNQLQTVALHEMAHALGFGTIWQNLGLIIGATGADPRFIGPNAVAEYNARFGLTSTSVPVENLGAPGSADQHWRESLLTTELMTSVLNSGANPLTRLTIAQFADLGYQVDYSQADAVSLVNSASPLNIRTTARPRNASGPIGQFLPIGSGDTAVGDAAVSEDSSSMQNAINGYTRVVNSTPLLVFPGIDASKVGQAWGTTVEALAQNEQLRLLNARLQIPEVEPNNSIANAVSIDNSFSLDLDPNIGDTLTNTSTTIPHVSIQGSGDGTYDYFSFTVTNSGDRGIFDIDFTNGNDMEIFLFDAAGNFLFGDDDSSTSDGQGGSTSGLDSYMEFTFTSPGTYIIGVAEFSSSGQNGGITGDTIDPGTIYTLQVSIENHLTGGGGPAPVAPLFGDTLIGDDGNDTLIGSPGDDLINGNAGNDSILGDDGHDTIYGGAGADSIDAGAGNDSVRGNAGTDTINSGEGDDFMLWRVHDGNDLIQDAPGLDDFLIEGTATADTFNIGQNAGTMRIGYGSAVISVESGSTIVTINGLGGNDTFNVGNLDTITGLSLNLNGGLGRDTFNLAGSNTGSVRIKLDGGDGNDSYQGGLNDETIIGGEGNDSINGGGGNDLIQGLGGDDTLIGGDGDDTLEGGTGIDSLLGGSGNDTLNGGTNNDTLEGGDGNDSLVGESGNDSLKGDAGNDSLLGVAGDDQLEGGDGNDFLNGGTENDAILGQAGDDTIRGGDGDDGIYGGTGNDVINAGDGNDVVDGQGGDDTITGSDGNDTIRGGQGNDIIVGGDGDDLLVGQGGQDTILAGDGNDVIRGNGGTDLLAGGEGTNSFGLLGTDYTANEIDELFELSTAIKLLLEALPPA